MKWLSKMKKQLKNLGWNGDSDTRIEVPCSVLLDMAEGCDIYEDLLRGTRK
jgi:hypothetical protein